MKRLCPIILLLLGGCLSNAPVANFLDFVRPGKLRTNAKVQPHGGVCIPQGTLGGPPIPPPPVMGGALIPPPMIPPPAVPPGMNVPPPLPPPTPP